nr:hypothetical protein GCM10020092_073560 [Actinoplanes digitatis]
MSGMDIRGARRAPGQDGAQGVEHHGGVTGQPPHRQGRLQVTLLRCPSSPVRDGGVIVAAQHQQRLGDRRTGVRHRGDQVRDEGVGVRTPAPDHPGQYLGVRGVGSQPAPDRRRDLRGEADRAGREPVAARARGADRLDPARIAEPL